MDQQKLFYNICSDLWNFSKTLNKSSSEMTDEDWSNAIQLMDKTAEKYRSLGEKEHDLAYSSMMGILNYIENKGKNGKRTVLCTIPEKMTRNINSAKCDESLDKDIVIIASAEGGIASAEDGTASNENEESNIKLKNGDTYGNGGEKNGKGVGGLVIIK